MRGVSEKIVKKVIHAPNFLNEPIEYSKSFSRGIKVNLGRIIILFISGTASTNERGKSCFPGDFFAQAKRTFYNIKALLQSEGTSWHDVVQTRCYLKDMRYYDKFNEVRNLFYKKQRLKPFPASVCIEANLCRPELLVEIEAIAIIKSPIKLKYSKKLK